MRVSSLPYRRILSALLGLGLLATAAPDAFSQTVNPRIINGQSVPNGQYPWMASIHFAGHQPGDASGGHMCGGSLIHPEYVLTAAHCANSFRATPTQLAVTLGRTTLSDTATGVTVGIKSLQIHPQYNSNTNDFDVALLRLSSPVTSIAPVRIVYPGATGIQNGGTGTITGWGVTSTAANALPSNVMRQATISIPLESACVATMGASFHPGNMFCAGRLATAAGAGNGVDSCYGDSGGPLVAAVPLGGQRVTGVVSWGYSCGSNLYYGVYARLDVVSSWIFTNVPIAPAPVIAPALTGTTRAGQTLHCNHGTWDTLSNSYNYIFETETGEQLASGNAIDFQLSAAEIGKKIRCTVTNTSGNGATGSESTAFLGPIQEIAPTPTPTQGAKDTRPPKFKSVKKYCEVLNCRAVIDVQDDRRGTVSGLKDVSIEGTWYGKSCAIPAGGTRNVCTRIQSPIIFTSTVDPTTSFLMYTFSAPAKGRIKGTILATDNAGGQKLKKYSLSVRDH